MHAGSPASGGFPVEPDLTAPNPGLRAYWAVAVRRKWLIALGLLTTVVAAMAVTSLHKPVYRAETQVLVAPPAGDIAAATRANIPNEIQILQDRKSTRLNSSH